MNQRKKEILILAAFLLLQSVLYVIAGVHKSYIHMDEAYSLGLASYDKVEIQDNKDFYGQWHNGEYYEDYLSLQDDEKGSFYQVYKNQKNDVHPPLYYLFLRLGMTFDGGHYNKWPGITINIFIYLFITIFMYLIAKKVFSGQENTNRKARLTAFLSSITMAALTNAIYIRMYALLNFFIVLTAFLHIKLSEDDKNHKTMILISITALLGSLTHYYYLFFLAALCLMFGIRYLKNKDYKSLGKYIGIMGIAGALSLCIFPYSIQHMFFGYRGQGFMEKLLDYESFFVNIAKYLHIIQKYVFNNILMVILAILFVLYKLRKDKNKKFENPNSDVLKILYIPTIFYFIIVAVASPWQELRYIMPVGGVIYLIVIYYLYQWSKTIFSDTKSDIALILVFVSILVSPSVFKIEPQVAYTDRKDIVTSLEGELNVPTIYMLNSSNNRFLDDILLFSKLDESYIAKDMKCTEDNIKTIFENKDTSNGIVVFINLNQENDALLDVIKKALSLEDITHLKHLNACDVYYVK